MASQFYAPIYRRNQYDTSNTNGVLYSFPVSGTFFAPTDVVANGVQMNSIITLAPKGLNQPARLFYTPYTVSDLNAYANGTTEPTTTTTTTTAP